MRKEWPFENSYVISMRPERMERFRSLFGDTPQLVPAIDGQNEDVPSTWKSGAGAWGCFQSHLKAMRLGLRTGKPFLVFEDDAMPMPGFWTGMRQFTERLPQGWDQAYLGGYHWRTDRWKPTKLSSGILKVRDVQWTHTYALSPLGADRMIEHLEAWETYKEPKWHIDHCMNELQHQPHFKTYAPPRWLVSQGCDVSDVSGRELGMYSGVHKAVVLVVGCHHSGTTMTTEILKALGVKFDPGAGNESKEIATLCEQAFPFPSTRRRLPASEITQRLGKALNGVRRRHKGKLMGIKYPTLGAMLDYLPPGDDIYILSCARSVNNSIASIQKRWTRHDPGDLTRVQEWLNERRHLSYRKILDECGGQRVLTLDYDMTVDYTRREIERLSEWLPIDIDEEQIEAAIAVVDPEKRHYG